MKKINVCIAAGALLCASLTGCSFDNPQRFTNYVQGMLDLTYFNESGKYIETTKSTAEEAQEIYDGQVEYLASGLCEYCNVYYDIISDDIYAGYQELAERVLAKAKYTVSPAVKSGDTYHITVSGEPMDFLDIVVDPVNEVVEGYLDSYEAYYDVDYEELENDPEYIALEEAYAQDVLDALNSCVDSISYGTAQNIIVAIEEDDEYYFVADKTWLDIDDLLLGLDENAYDE